MTPPQEDPERPTPWWNDRGLWTVAALSTLWCAWVYGPWLALPQGAAESSGFIGRAWDIRQQLVEHGLFPWWTGNFMGGTSYDLHHSQGLYLVPTLLLSAVMDLPTAVKVTCVLALWSAALTAWACAREFLGDSRAAVASALVFMLHPQLMQKTMAVEHVGVIVFVPFLPLAWMWLRRVLHRGDAGSLLGFALSSVGMLGAHNKQAMVHALFLGGYAAFSVAGRRERQVRILKALGLAAGLGAFLWVPAVAGLAEARLFLGDPFREWQDAMSFHSLLGIWDRGGVVLTSVLQGVSAALSSGAAPSPQALDVLAGLRGDVGSGYDGAVVLLCMLVALWWRPAWILQPRLSGPWLGWLAGLMLAFGHRQVWPSHMEAVMALFLVDGVPWGARALAVLVSVVAVATPLRVLQGAGLERRGRLLLGVTVAVFFLVPAFSGVDRLPLLGNIRAPSVFHDFVGVFFSSLVVGAVVLEVLRLRVRADVVIALLGTCILLDVYPSTTAWKAAQRPAERMAHIREAYQRVALDEKTTRTYAVSSNFVHLLGPMWSGKAQAYEAFYYMAPRGLGLLQLATESSPHHLALLNHMAVGWVLQERSGTADPRGDELLATYASVMETVSTTPELVLLHNPHALPYARVFSSFARSTVPVEDSAPESLRAMVGNGAVLHARAGSAEPRPPVQPDTQPAAVHSTRVDAHTIRVEVRDTPGLLVLAESFHPSWTVDIDGVSMEAARVNTLFLGVELPPGASVATFHFQVPSTHRWAALLSLASLALLLRPLVGRRRPPAQH